MTTCLSSPETEGTVALCDPVCPQKLTLDVEQVDCVECLDRHMGALVERIHDSVVELQKCRDRFEELHAKRLTCGE